MVWCNQKINIDISPEHFTTIKLTVIVLDLIQLT